MEKLVLVKPTFEKKDKNSYLEVNVINDWLEDGWRVKKIEDASLGVEEEMGFCPEPCYEVIFEIEDEKYKELCKKYKNGLPVK